MVVVLTGGLRFLLVAMKLPRLGEHGLCGI